MHGIFYFFPAPSWHAVESGKVLVFIKSVFFGLIDENLWVFYFIIIEELPAKQIPNMLIPNKYGGYNVPHVVPAPVGTGLSLWYTAAQDEITLNAVL